MTGDAVIKKRPLVSHYSLSQSITIKQKQQINTKASEFNKEYIIQIPGWLVLLCACCVWWV